MLTYDLFMSTCDLFMSTSNIIQLVNIIISLFQNNSAACQHKWITYYFHIRPQRLCSGLESNVCPASGGRIPAATDLRRKTGSDSLVIGVSVTGPRIWLLKTDFLCHKRCWTLRSHHCSTAISAEHSSDFASFYCGHGNVSKFSEKFSIGTKTPNKQNTMFT